VMTVLPSEEDASRLFKELLAQGVITRPLKAFGLPNCLRISTGSDEDNQFFVDALRKSYAANLGASRAD
jgi:histidinol-phosphate aminotransferase